MQLLFCRYIHVCHPLKAMRWCKIRIARRVMLGIVIVTSIYNIPRFFEYYKILEVSLSGTFNIHTILLGIMFYAFLRLKFVDAYFFGEPSIKL